MASAAEGKRREERVKLFATALSNAGVATIVTGFIAPLVVGRLSVGGLGAILAGAMLHLVAQRVMHYVADDPKPEPTTWDS